MRVHVELEGVSGLVMHNSRLADPQDKYTRMIAEITSKRKKTDADYDEIARLEWFGGLYHDPDIGVYLPSWGVVRCFEQAAKVTRKGTSLIRAFSVFTDRVPLDYDGPRDLAKLWDMPEHRFRTQVVVNNGRVTRMRPIFRRWRLAIDGELLDDVMNLRDFTQIVDLAGRAEGLYEARKLGYGRFIATVTADEEEAAA